MLAAIKSLGLFDDRLRSLVALTDTFLRGAPLEPSKKKSPRADEFKVETDRKSVHKVHGVGPFSVESWLVFCKDQGATIIGLKLQGRRAARALRGLAQARGQGGGLVVILCVQKEEPTKITPNTKLTSDSPRAE